MQRRRFFASLAAAASPLTGQTQSPPNVLLLLYDKCRADAIGCYGNSGARTPHLDQLAATGVRFEHAYTPQALCGPARASMLTGLYPHAHGVRRNVYPAPAGRTNTNFADVIVDPFRDSRFRLWDNIVYQLNNAGYATGCVGKWHLGPANPGFFDTFKAFNSLLRHWVGTPHKSAYRPDVETDEGIRFIEANAGRPWFLYQSYYAPHEPLDPPRQWASMFAGKEHADYHATIANLDWNTGRLLDTLRRRNLLDNTLIIFTADHGRTWIDRPGSAEGIALSYEEVARVPLIVRYPSRLASGKVWKSGVDLTALTPTILDACGISLEQGLGNSDLTPSLHGSSLMQTMAGPDNWKQPVILQNVPQRAVEGSYFDERAVRTAKYKLILRKFDLRPAFRPGELYDLDSDPGEQVNLYAKQPRVVADLAKQLEAWAVRARDETALELARYCSAL
ncbi:MAG: sulfatase-like hydrolase/transferase [Candidatus Solibacter usitatus]|nr:sulfatase-like hydrolase/transferase [Candidatus Solibacter usitatus]